MPQERCLIFKSVILIDIELSYATPPTLLPAFSSPVSCFWEWLHYPPGFCLPPLSFIVSPFTSGLAYLYSHVTFWNETLTTPLPSPAPSHVSLVSCLKADTKPYPSLYLKSPAGFLLVSRGLGSASYRLHELTWVEVIEALMITQNEVNHTEKLKPWRSLSHHLCHVEGFENYFNS